MATSGHAESHNIQRHAGGIELSILNRRVLQIHKGVSPSGFSSRIHSHFAGPGCQGPTEPEFGPSWQVPVIDHWPSAPSERLRITFMAGRDDARARFNAKP